nr:PREDICTED: proteasome subunit beta type-1-like [Balearica regulorum gibbericeps]
MSLQSYSVSALLMSVRANKLCTTWPNFRGKCVRDQSIVPGSRKVMQRHLSLCSGGKGAVYSFDPVGSYQRDSFKAGGSASAMLQPLLDNQIGFKNMQNVEHVPLTLEKALQLVKDVFISAAERDVYTGDALKICVVTKDGIKEETVQLRRD